MRILLFKILVPVLLLPISGPAAPEGDTPKDDAPLKADPANDLFELAQLTYHEALETKKPKQREETLRTAIRQFDRFRQAFPGHPRAIKSWYYSAVCYRKLGETSKFRSCLAAIVQGWKTGPLVGAAAYQLALEHYKAEQYDKAAPLFRRAAAEIDDESSRHRALYSLALCHEKLDRRPETIAALKKVLSDEGSPFREKAETVLAHYYKEDHRKEEALAHFIHLAKSDNRETRADAILQCALLARDLGKKEFARRYFESILTTPGLEKWRGEAQLALMSEASLDGNHERVLEFFKKGRFPLDKDHQARRLQLAAKALEALDRPAEAVPLYRELEKLSPESATGFEAAYAVLTRAHKDEQGDLARHAEQFLQRYQKDHPDDLRIHNARLMLAEARFKEGQFKAAAGQYARIDPRHIAPENHAGLRYRLASALLEAGRHEEALKAFETFLDQHPGDSRAPRAIIKRADTFLAIDRAADAQNEYQRLIETTGDPKLLEYAWARKAHLHKKADQLELFELCHQHLAEDFPGRDPAKIAASRFWIGWARFRRDLLQESIPFFRQAREGDPEALGREATLHLALAHYGLEERDPLRQELDRLLSDYPKTKVPRPVFAWLGAQFARKERYADAWKYLQHAITPEHPAQTKVAVWRAAGRSALEAGDFQAALRPFGILVKIEDNPFRKAELHFLTARAHAGLKEFDKARAAAQRCLELKPQGDLNAHARLLLGDVDMATGDPAAASRHYVVVVEFYSSNPAIRNKALGKAANALELTGDKKSLRTARQYRRMLSPPESANRGKP